MTRLPSLSFEGRVVVVTGAGRGIGREAALLLAERGARLVLHNRLGADGREDPAGELVESIRARGGLAVAERSDVRDPGSAPALVALALSAFGRLDAVVANAGLIESRSVAELEEEDIARLYETNALSAFRLTRAALPALRAHGTGRLVYTTSTAGLYGGPGLAAYGMAKAAVVALMRSVAAEERARGVLANAICPTAVTRMTEDFVADPESRDALSPRFVAPAIGWLASDACAVTGRVVLASGGIFRSAHALQSEGVDLRARDPIGPEDVAASAESILAAERLSAPADAGAHFATVLQTLARPRRPWR
jgi:NAD(P)-dependent dehydrogenase (short-subunit alcohol dehydrogenase family)